MAGLFDWLGSGIEAGAEPQAGGLFGQLFGSGIEAGAAPQDWGLGPGFGTGSIRPNAMIAAGKALMRPDENAWANAASAFARGVARGREQNALRLAALGAALQKPAAATAAPARAPLLRGAGIGRQRNPGPRAPLAPHAGNGVSQRPAPPLRIRLDAQGRRIG
jgi:hypothetical protein